MKISITALFAGCATVLFLVCPVAASSVPAPEADGAAQRAYQVDVMKRLAGPVLRAGAEAALRERLTPIDGARNRFAPLEALGRVLAGAAPWLELGPGEDAEGRLREEFILLALKSIEHGTDPASPGFLNFREGGQPLVDTAFLAQGLVRAPRQLWGRLDTRTRENVIAALRSTRVIKPHDSNWLLFSAMVEAALLEFTGECEMKPLDYAVNRHREWYVGDGTYGDGPKLRWDYYNAFVIQPMLLEVVEICARHGRDSGTHFAEIERRFRRHADVQERLISPEGTFPVIGRSATYRFGAFQVLSMAALRHRLPDDKTPGAVRSALHAVISRMIEAPGTFDDNGWLRVGVVGAQPAQGEVYINSGSVYLCTFGLLHLGLPADDVFWTAPAAPWTQRRLWAGENLPADKALKD
jgi:hypothetical protein